MGRSVVICEFSSGLRLVYKPRSLAADIHFQALVKWFNQRGFLPALRVSQILDRVTHGWVQFIAAEGCDSEAALSRFYERHGACLALLHALAATDFHCENVIAAGEDPMLVDLEAIFHPTCQDLKPNETTRSSD
jgi:lantibiotic modifying enzyme